jgi:peptidoglycan/LPS O-acetylase OafA/YrhL
VVLADAYLLEAATDAVCGEFAVKDLRRAHLIRPSVNKGPDADMSQTGVNTEPIARANITPAAGRDDVPIPKAAEQHRFHMLDAVRGVAAILVVIYHAPVHPILFPESWLAVDIFFCLSGFVICASYEQKLATKMSMKTFILTRFIRLYPVHLLGMSIMSLDIYLQHRHHSLVGSEASPLTIVFGFLLLPVFRSQFYQTFPLNWPTWSLFFEIIANIFYALLLRLRVAKTALLIAICAVSITLLAISVRWSSGGFNVGWGTHSFFQGFARVGYSFFAGVLLFRMYRSNIRLHLTQALSNFASISIVVLVIVVLTQSVSPERKWAYEGLIIGLVFPAMVFVGACCKISGYWIKVCSFCGDVSYPLYLLHKPLMFYLSFILAHVRVEIHPVATAFGMVAVLVPICWWVGKYIDAPTRRYLAVRLRRKEAAQPMPIVAKS